MVIEIIFKKNWNLNPLINTNGQYYFKTYELSLWVFYVFNQSKVVRLLSITHNYNNILTTYGQMLSCSALDGSFKTSSLNMTLISFYSK